MWLTEYSFCCCVFVNCKGLVGLAAQVTDIVIVVMIDQCIMLWTASRLAVCPRLSACCLKRQVPTPADLCMLLLALCRWRCPLHLWCSWHWQDCPCDGGIGKHEGSSCESWSSVCCHKLPAATQPSTCVQQAVGEVEWTTLGAS